MPIFNLAFQSSKSPIAQSAMIVALVSFQPFPTDTPERGVSLTLAQDRASRIRDVRYDLQFSIPADAGARVEGRAVITFALTGRAGGLALDFAAVADVRRVLAGGREIAFRTVPEHVILPESALGEGANEIAIEFLAGDAALNRNPEFLYTLFVPARARLAFPCFDQPDLKAKYRLALDIPEAWSAIANGEETGRETAGDRLRLRFAETQP